MIRTLSLLLTRALTGAHARGLAHKPAQRIYCANHTSHLDTVLLLAALPRSAAQRARPVAAADYWRKGLRRFLAERAFQTVFVERNQSTLNPLDPAFEALRRGDSLIFYPEGTRGPGGTLQPLKPGLFYLARAFRHVEIVPVWIDAACRILPKHAMLPLPEPCTLTFGAPLRWDGHEDAPAFLSRARAAMEAAQRESDRAAMLPAQAVLQP